MNAKSIKDVFTRLAAGDDPRSRVSVLKPGAWTRNKRILLGDAGHDRGSRIFKIKKIIQVSRPGQDFLPFLFIGSDSQAIVGARLTRHGGHVAVEVARHLVKHVGSQGMPVRLLVLDGNVLLIRLVPDQMVEKELLDFVEKHIETCKGIAKKFKEKIGEIIGR